MEFYREHLLSIVIFTPLAGALVLLLPPFRGQAALGAVRLVANLVALAGFLASLPLWLWFARGQQGFQFVEKLPWIPSIGVQYLLGVDGISALLVLLTTLLGQVAILSSWSAVQERVRAYYVFLLLLQTGMIGVFCALDMFLFYVFWEVMLVPMYFLIGIWGGQRRLYAAIKFFLYTLAGSVVMLLGILALYFHAKTLPEYAATGSFDYTVWLRMGIPQDLQFWVFLAFFLGFAIKVPMFPFHTWLPDAHVEAPTAGSVILAGVLLKMGTYGFVRFSLPLLPQATLDAVPWMAALSIIGIVYAGLVTLVQKDMKKLVAYSSVSHLGFVMLGMFALNPLGLEGSVLQMVNHGLSTGGLFLVVGMLYERRHTREIAQFGGLAHVMPVYASFTLVIFLASVGVLGGLGHRARRGVPAVALPARVLGQAAKRRERSAPRHRRARARDARADRGAVLLDRRLPEAVPRVPPRARGTDRGPRPARQVRGRRERRCGTRPRGTRRCGIRPDGIASSVNRSLSVLTGFHPAATRIASYLYRR